jgi:hypothetical protein
MKKYSLVLGLTLSILASFAQTTDVVYATDNDNGKIRKASANPVTGEVSGSFTSVKDITPSAALGASNDGWLYFLQYGDGGTASLNGKVDIWATKADGTGTPKKIYSNFDVNGSSNDELGFVRLGLTSDKKAYLVAKETNGNDIYLATFTVNGNNDLSTPTRLGKMTTNDNSNYLFANGDLCFDGPGNMYVLANNEINNQNITKIYVVSKSTLAAATSSSSVTQMSAKWVLKTQNGNSFSGSVNGCAFASFGSMYISTDDGLYFIDQYTVNNLSAGTVQCKRVKEQSNLTDLATAYWPGATLLPMKFGEISVRLTVTKQ